MINNDLPKVMAISLSAWRKNSGTHTQTDLFKFYNPDKVAQIYTRSELPDTSVCNTFFRISENEVLKSVINRKKVGKKVENSAEPDKAELKSIKMENAIYTMAHKKKSWFLTIVREIVWSLGKWKTWELDKFIECYNPDVYFIPVYSVIYTAKIQLYILKKFPRPYVCYTTDDNYSYKSCGKNIFAYIHRFFLRHYVKKLSENSTKMFVMTNTQKKEVDKNFGTDSIILTKGINYENLEYSPKECQKPIKMVYTGNLLIGRAKTLVEISKAMKKINKDKEKITFDIFSTTILNKKTLQYLNSHGCHFRGSVPKAEVDEIQKKADIVVFSESLDKKYRYEARLSFSTKLTDYFKNGKCIFAIGDENIAPIIYLKNNDCAVIANSYDQIDDILKRFIENPNIIGEYAKKAFLCGKRNHNEQDIKKTFIETFLSAYTERKELKVLNNRCEIENKLVDNGFPEVQAKIVADCLVTADEYGVSSHGSAVVEAHIKRISEGGYNLKPDIRVIRETGAFALIDGDNAIGPYCAEYCMNYAIEKSAGSGVFTVFSRNNNTFGPAFYYPLIAAKKNCIGIAFSNSPAQMAPYGGKEKMLGTNPFSVVIPCGDKDPLIFDMATSVVAKSKFKEYKNKGMKLPEGWALDKEGKPTTDPDEAMAGFVLPMAGFKGFGLAMIIDIISGVVSGASFLNKVGRFYDNNNCMNVGFCFIAINPKVVFGEEFEEIMGNYIETLRSSETVEGGRISLPGDDRLEFYKRDINI